MGKFIWWSFVLLALAACGTTIKDGENLPRFSYVDGLQTQKRVNCASGKPMDCMTCALQGEAANQPGRGIYAVGVTIMTRAQGSIDRICKVTKARRQFEGMRRRGRMKISKKVWVVTGHIMDSKETGWTHFWAPRTQYQLKRRKPFWATRYEQRQCKKEKIGDHVFFNNQQCKYNRKMRLNAQTPADKTPGS